MYIYVAVVMFSFLSGEHNGEDGRARLHLAINKHLNAQCKSSGCINLISMVNKCVEIADQIETGAAKQLHTVRWGEGKKKYNNRHW